MILSHYRYFRVHSQSQFHDPVDLRCAPALGIMRTVRYGIVPTLRRYSKKLRWNPSLHSVLYNAHWRSSSLVKNLERQWRNGWCLTRHLAISVTSQVPILFGFNTWCEYLARDMGFKRRLDPQMYFLGVKHEEKESKVISSSFGEEAILLDGFPRDVDSRNHAINSSRFGKIRPSHASLHSDLRATWQANKQTDRH